MRSHHASRPKESVSRLLREQTGFPVMKPLILDAL